MKPDSSSGWGDDFVSLRWRSNLVQILLVASILTDVVAACLVFVEVALVGDAIAGRRVDLEALQTNSDRATALGAVSVIALVVTAVAWWVWQYRGQANLYAAARRGLLHRPWGAVGWWLVPIANLWMPFQTVRELWKASEPIEDPGAWPGVATWAVLGWWWALWIVGNVLQSATGFATETTDLETIRTADLIALAGLAGSVFATCLAIGVVRQISARQQALAAVPHNRPTTVIAPPSGALPYVPPAPFALGSSVPPPPPPPPDFPRPDVG
jgi:Domain of unknown function (DUF4328)